MTLILETSHDKPPLDALRERYEKDPNSKVFMPLAEQLRRRGCYAEAIDICRRAKKAHPRYVSCRVLLGRCFIELGMREEARRELEEVLELDRENVFSLRVMAEVLRAQGTLKGAVDYYRALLRISPTDMDAQQRLTELAQLLENSEDRATSPPSHGSDSIEGESACQLPEEEPSAVDHLSVCLGSATEVAKASTRGSCKLFKREIRRSDFSRFAQWISISWQESVKQQGGARSVGQEQRIAGS
jgi:tetratricopeptide (TPR) repeat protein